VELRERLDTILLFAPGFRMQKVVRERLDVLHDACVGRRAVAFGYEREDGASSRREVRPLALYFFSGVWTLASWCELRKDFRTFRLDRMDGLRPLERTFVQKRGQRLEDFLRRVKERTIG
jgi:predicted DNA-binding transcriptional regulator YafY